MTSDELEVIIARAEYQMLIGDAYDDRESLKDCLLAIKELRVALDEEIKFSAAAIHDLKEQAEGRRPLQWRDLFEDDLMAVLVANFSQEPGQVEEIWHATLSAGFASTPVYIERDLEELELKGKVYYNKSNFSYCPVGSAAHKRIGGFKRKRQ